MQDTIHRNKIAQVAGIAYKSLLFIYNNIPTLKELVIYSSIQSLIEIAFDTDKSFGNNPVEKSFIRDGAKIPGEFSLATQFAQCGGTEFWHDEFSLASAVQKPALKLTIIGLYRLFDKDTEFYLDKVNQLIKADGNSTSSNVSENIHGLLEKYISAGALGGAARLSNFVGEPISRLIDGVSKAAQSAVLDMAAAAKSDGSVISDYQNNGWVNVSNGFMEHGLSVMPFGLTYALLKTAGLDSLGKFYGKIEIGGKRIKGWFIYTREDIVDKQLFSLVDEDLVNLNRLSIYERKDIIFAQEDLSNTMKYLTTVASFMTEWVEKTLSNMFTMALFSTPNKALGNALYALDGVAPLIFRPIGMVSGVFYVKNEFFDFKEKDSTFLSFVQKSGLDLTQEDLYYVTLIDEVLTNKPLEQLQEDVVSDNIPPQHHEGTEEEVISENIIPQHNEEL
jgi:hypothetical protein